MGESEGVGGGGQSDVHTTTTAGTSGVPPAGNAAQEANNHLGVRGLTKLEEKEVRCIRGPFVQITLTLCMR